MATKQTHTFKTVGPLHLKVDIYTRSSSSTHDPKRPIVLFLHGGGFVAFDRASLPPHIVQSCLTRNWPLVSADYRKLPQINGKEVLQDLKDAYQFAVEKIPGLLSGGKEEKCEKVIVVGQSAGAYMSLLCGHYMNPRPIAVLAYHSMPTVSASYFNSCKILGPSGAKPMLQSQFQSFLDEPATIGSTPAARAFDLSCLSSDLSENLEYQKPSEEERKAYPARLALVRWLLQTNAFPELLGGVDRDLGDSGWKDFPGTILVHGDEDAVVPIELSKELVGVIGPTPVKLFIAQGQNHGFDGPLFLGDSGLAVVEEAWEALDGIVKTKV